MPQHQPACNKCRSGKQAEGDSWYLGCSALEVASQQLRRKWNNPGLRAIAEEALLSSAKLVRGFGSLDNNLLTAAAVDKGPLASAKSKRERARSRSPLRDDRPPLRRQPPIEERRRSPVREEEESYEEESAEEEAAADTEQEVEPEEPSRKEVKQEIRGSEKPPEPDYPPKWAKSEPSYKNREDRSPRREEKKKKKKKKNKGKRGGTRHQRHHRENYDPLRRSHRRYPAEGLRLSRSLAEGLSRRE